MTRSLVIVNMSNGDNEDFHVRGISEGNAQTDVVIAPGETAHVSFPLLEQAFHITPVTNEDADEHAHTYRKLNIEVEGTA